MATKYIILYDEVNYNDSELSIGDWNRIDCLAGAIQRSIEKNNRVLLACDIHGAKIVHPGIQSVTAPGEPIKFELHGNGVSKSTKVA